MTSRLSDTMRFYDLLTSFVGLIGVGRSTDNLTLYFRC